VLRVFTRDGGGGNALGVHEGLLDPAAMQALAAALGYSETIFLGDPTPIVTPVRIFTPTYEMPFAGHPLVGATWHLARLGSTVDLGCPIGTVTGRRTGGDRAGIDVVQLPTAETAVFPDDVASAWVVRMPLEYQLHRLRGVDAVAGYDPIDRPDHRYVYAFGDDGDEAIVRARFFAAGLGVDEDPATGSAAVALAAVERHQGRTSGALTIHQGAEMGQPSRLELSWTPTATTISGTVSDDGWTTVSL